MLNRFDKRPHFYAKALVCMSLLAFLSSCIKAQEADARLTIEVMDAGVVYSGSAEQHIWCSPELSALRSDFPTSCTVSGDAVSVHIPGKPALYMLKLPPLPHERTPDTDYLRLLWRSHPKGNSRKWEVAEAYWPQLAVANASGDPAALVRVDPKDLPSIYGDSFRIKSVRIQVEAIRPYNWRKSRPM